MQMSSVERKIGRIKISNEIAVLLVDENIIRILHEYYTYLNTLKKDNFGNACQKSKFWFHVD